jgi:cytochrome c-type biogenesis protein CcmH/NrfF
MHIINYRSGELDLKSGEFEESAESEDANCITRELRCQKCLYHLTKKEEEKLNL